MSGVVLASGSSARAAMLTAAGVPFVRDVADVDEGAVKEACRAAGRSAADVAAALAVRKAGAVSARHPGALVIGADQMLECDGAWFDKPADREGARQQLLRLRGRTHRLISAAVVLRDETVLGEWVTTADLTMRDFGEGFLDDYLDMAGDAVLTSVGAYRIEGEGIQLFERMDGDTFTIKGMPLLPVLEALRQHGVLKR